ncbi:uncharacterized protein LOC135166665 isoform X2 [Diachasmimorpha longicaudata]|uniref:uncharacterized protein LOC135166665 isoform X2 n=1 Tax=Diachasmimorpha longicaudata TaxID=58733 RepID=UPI0030B8FE5D
MCPKPSKNKAKGKEVMKNKQNGINNSENSKVVARKKSKGNIKHDKRMMKKKAKSATEAPDDSKFKKPPGVEMCQTSDRSSTEETIEPGENDGRGNDLDISNQVESAFVQSIIGKTGLKVGRDKEDVLRPVKLNLTEEELQEECLDGFKRVKKGKIAKGGINKTSEGFGFEAYKYIIEGKPDRGTEFLTRALALDSSDIRHYFNRSYSQLCSGNYEEALRDIQFVMTHTDDTINLSRLKCRQGQIFMRMEEFEKAEQCFKECLNLFPNNKVVRCELFRSKIAKTRNIEDSPENSISISDADIYESDSEENPSYARLFMEMANFSSFAKDDLPYREPNENKNTSSTSDSKVVRRGQSEYQSSEIAQHITPSPAIRELRVINASGAKKAVLKTPPKINVNNRAVWVGSLTSAITESALKRAFSCYGRVASVYRTPDSTCAFVNFENAASAKLALDAQSLNVNGQLLPIRLNRRAK